MKETGRTLQKNSTFQFEPCGINSACIGMENAQDGSQNVKLDAFENAIKTLNTTIAKLEDELAIEKELAAKLIRQLAEHQTEKSRLAIEDYEKRRLIRPKGLPQ